MQEIISQLLSPTSIWSVVLRAAVWFGIAVVIIASIDAAPKVENVGQSLKVNLGMFLFFIVLSGGLLFLLFGFVPA